MSTNLPDDLDIPANVAFGKPVLDKAFSYIVNRFLLIESFKPSYQAAIDQLNNIGLNRIATAIQPIYTNLAQYAHIGAIFSTTSTTSVTVAKGPQTFIIASTDWGGFAPAAYIGVQHRGDVATYMQGRVSSYDPTSGTLVLNVDSLSGAGSTFADWIISASVQPPSSLDIGASVNAQINTLQTNVNNQLSSFQSGINTQVASLAPLASPAFTGAPTAPQTANSDSSQRIATTGFVQNLIAIVQQAVAGVTNAVGVPIRTDANQSLTAAQQLTARTNAGSAAKGANTDITSMTGLTSMTCSGTGTFGGVVTGAGVVGTAVTGVGQIVARTANFSMGLYADGGSQAYIMATATGNATGTWSGFRPFSWNVTNGVVSIAADGAATNVGGSLTVGGAVNFPNARPTWAGTTPWDAGNLGAQQVWNILGCRPLANYNGTASNQIGMAWSGGRVRAIVDNSDQGAIWTDSTLSAGQIGGILGYTPARPSTVVETSAGGQSDLSPNARQYIVGVSFTAQANNFLGVARTAFLNNTSGGTQDAYFNVDIVDNATGQQVNLGVETSVTTVFGQGWKQATAQTAASNLTVGRSYQFRCYVYKTSTSSVVATQNYQLDGANY